MSFSVLAPDFSLNIQDIQADNWQPDIKFTLLGHIKRAEEC